jgi:hypothetical protein
MISVSCSNGNKAKIPDDIIRPDTMVEVITDVNLVQASQRMGIVIDTADTGAYTSFNYVWRRHRITEDEYKKSLAFYTHNPALLDSMYEKVLNNLSKQKALLMGKKRSK